MTTQDSSIQQDNEKNVDQKTSETTESIEPLQDISRINDIKVKKLSFNYRDFEKKMFEKAEKKLKKRICDRIEEWSTFSRREVIQEVKTFGLHFIYFMLKHFPKVYPCANSCYEAEPLDFNRWKVTCPVTTMNQNGKKELKFMNRFRVVLNLVNCDRDSLEVKWWENENVVLVKGKTKDKLNEGDEEAPGCCRSTGFNFGRKFKLPSRVNIEKARILNTSFFFQINYF